MPLKFGEVQVKVELCRPVHGESPTSTIPERRQGGTRDDVPPNPDGIRRQCASFEHGCLCPRIQLHPRYSLETFSYIQTEPGQYEKCLDYLAGNWRKVNELQKKEAMLVSYHIFAVNNPRNGEPDLGLALEYKGYVQTAQQLEIQKKVEALLTSDAHKQDTASG